MTYNKLTQSQVELWLNDPVTKTYLQCLWWSQDQLKEVLGNGGCIDMTSMEKTFSESVITEGKKQGYQSAVQVVDELSRHDMIEEDADVEMPDISTILED